METFVIYMLRDLLFPGLDENQYCITGRFLVRKDFADTEGSPGNVQFSGPYN